MSIQTTLRDRWQAVSAREQRLVLVALTLVLVALSWWLAVAPAMKVLKTADVQHQALELQLRQMQRLQAQAKGLQALPTLDATQTRQALEASLKPLAAGAKLTQQMDRVTVTLKGVPALALAQWLSAARQNAHATPTESHLKRAAADTWDGSVVFTLTSP